MTCWIGAAATGGALLLACAAPLAARPARAPQDAPARAEPRIAMRDAVALAWVRAPERAVFAARQQSAATRARVGNAFVPNAPTASANYVNDRVAGNNLGYLALQGQVTTPIWLPGEGTATRRVGEAEGQVATADEEAAHLVLAARVVELAGQAALAANARNTAAQRLQTSRALAQDLVRRQQIGEGSASDALAAQADAASAEMALSTADAQLAAARGILASVTGTTVLPAFEPGPEPLGQAGGLGPDPLARHPRIVAAEQAMEAARANERLVRIGNRDDPEVGFQGINDKQPGTRWDYRFGVVATFHFATEARNAPRLAAAQQAITEANGQLLLARREVQAAVAEAMATLAGAEGASAAAERASSALSTRRGQIERAWRLGEMPLIEVVRANALSYDALYARDRARVDAVAARLRLRLARGALP